MSGERISPKASSIRVYRELPASAQPFIEAGWFFHKGGRRNKLYFAGNQQQLDWILKGQAKLENGEIKQIFN